MDAQTVRDEIAKLAPGYQASSSGNLLVPEHVTGPRPSRSVFYLPDGSRVEVDPDMPPIPPGLAHLDEWAGRAVPYIAWTTAGGTIDLDDVDGARFLACIREGLCAMCFGPDTLIRTRDGYVPISLIRVGDEVLSDDGRFNPVLSVMEREYDGLAYEFRSGSMVEPVLVTPEHPILTLTADHPRPGSRAKRQQTRAALDEGCWPGYCDRPDRPSRVKHDLAYVRVGDMQERSYVATVFPTDEQDRNEVEIPAFFRGTRKRNGPTALPLNDDMLWALGMYLAEGSAHARRVTFALHYKESDIADRLAAIFGGLGYGTRIREHADRNERYVDVHSSTLASWLPYWMGAGSENKAIPPELMVLPIYRLSHVLAGVLAGDGHNAAGRIGQTSRVLALQIVEIAARRGGSPTASHRAPANRKPVYDVLGTTWGGLLPPGGKKPGTWRIGDRLLAQVRERRSVMYAGMVYNLRVANNPTYCVQNIAVHNCALPLGYWKAWLMASDAEPEDRAARLMREPAMHRPCAKYAHAVWWHDREWMLVTRSYREVDNPDPQDKKRPILVRMAPAVTVERVAA